LTISPLVDPHSMADINRIFDWTLEWFMNLNDEGEGGGEGRVRQLLQSPSMRSV